MDNIIVETISTLGLTLLAISTVGVITIQYAKEKFKLSGNAAEIFSLIVGLILSGLVALVYAADLGYALELGQWVGLGLFVVLGTIGPSGGYKVIGSFTGSREV